VLNPSTGEFEERYWTAINTPILGHDGSVEYILHQAEDAATERRHGSMAILDAMTEGVFTLDRKWRFSYVNPEAYRILGQEPGSLIGGRIWDLFPGAEELEFGQHYHHTMQQRETRRFTAYYPGLKGWYEVTCYPAPEGISVYFRDVTARVVAEEEVREHNQRLIANRARLDYAVQLSGIGFWYCDLPFDELNWDDRVKEHFWLPPDARVTIETFYERIHPEDRDATRAAIAYSTENGTQYDVYYRTCQPDGDGIKWIRALGGTDFDAQGRPIRFDGVTVDVTAQKAAEEESQRIAARLRATDRRKDEFLAMLAHELRNPLAPVGTAAQILKRSSQEPARVAHAAEVIERQVGHLTSLVDDLLDVSRVTRGLVDIEREPVDLRVVVNAATEQVQPLLQNRGHALRTDIAAGTYHVLGDFHRLVQVVSNLLTNAAKYTQHNGRIDLGIAVEDGKAIVRVSDNGIGINPHLLGDVFELFTQAERTPDRAQGGLGIGLALVKSLVELHGGTVEAASEGAGRGSTFTVTLPIVARESLPATPVAHPTQPTRRRRILVVDDNVDAASTLAELLGMLGHEVEVVTNGVSALEAAEDGMWDTYVLDIGLPDMTGFELAQRLRQDRAMPGATFIALTGYGQPHDRVMSKAAGFDHHMVKPPDTAKLIDIMERA
jgi:PAS domain S-box-containing protein